MATAAASSATVVRTTNPDALLVRAIGVRQLAATIFNYTVGSGIFALPATAAAQLGPAAPLAYVACTVIMLLVVASFAEAGSRVSSTGGPYAYIEAAFGPFIGLLSGMVASALVYFLYLGKVLKFGSDLSESFWGAGIGFVVVAIVSVIVTMVTQPKPESELDGLVYGVGKTDVSGDALVGDRVWYRSPILLGTGALVLAVVFYLPFW